MHAKKTGRNNFSHFRELRTSFIRIILYFQVKEISDELDRGTWIVACPPLPRLYSSSSRHFPPPPHSINLPLFLLLILSLLFSVIYFTSPIFFFSSSSFFLSTY